MHYLRRFLPIALCFAFLISAACRPSLELSLEDRGELAEKAEKELLSEQLPIVERINQVLQANQARVLSVTDNAAWQIMHGVICYGNDLMVETPDRGRVSAVDYAFSGGMIPGFELSRGDQLATSGRYGLKARLEPGSYIGQGHVDQWIAIFAMADLPKSTEIQLGDDTYTIEDLARQAQYDVTRNILDEYSWSLIALTHYFPDEPSWDAALDARVSWEAMVAEELERDIDLSPCGGTHRLAGLVHALRAKQRLRLSESDTWDKAEALINRLYRSTKTNRGADGRLSSFYFTRAGGTVDRSAELASAGHLFEFAALACPDNELNDAWLQLSAAHLCDLMERSQELELDCGALYHALNGLKVYRDRIVQSGT